MMSKLVNKLKTLGACYEALDWASFQKGSFQDAWDECPRGDWMLWLLSMSKPDHKKIILASCKIARTVLKYVPKDEKRPLKAIQTTEAWAKGKATLKKVQDASNAAYLAASSASAAAAEASSAYYAASSSSAASSSAFAASSSAFAANAAAYAADAAYAARAAANAAADAAYYAAYASAAANAADAAEAAAAYAAANTNYVAAKEKSLLKSSKIIRKFFPKAPRF